MFLPAPSPNRRTCLTCPNHVTTYRRGNKSSSDPLMAAARQRLALWDMTETEIESLERRGKALDYVTIHASHAGTVIERHIADGSGARAGHPVLTIADLSRVWVEADVYEGDLALLTTGSNATIALPYFPGQTRTAQIEYIYPYLQAKTRTGKVRMTLDNAAGDLKPDMYAEVTLEVDLGHRLSVPEEAVLVAGGSRVVFVDLGEGRLGVVVSDVSGHGLGPALLMASAQTLMRIFVTLAFVIWSCVEWQPTS